MVIAPWLRAEVLRVLYKYTAGVPVLSVPEASEIASRAINKRDLRFMQHVTPEDLDLLNACLDAEIAVREDAYAALERLLALAQWSDGPLDERLLALPQRQLAEAVLCLYEVGWIDRS